MVSEHASKKLHYLLTKRPEFHQGDYAAAIQGALADEDALLLESFKNDSTEPATSGSTAAVCLIDLTQGELVVSNLGDSHVILAERDPKTDRPYHIVCHWLPISRYPPSADLIGGETAQKNDSLMIANLLATTHGSSQARSTD